MFNWLTENLFLVYQFYGAVFVLLGAASLALPRNNRLPFSSELWLLGCFGLLHGSLEFVEAALLVNSNRELIIVGHWLTLLSFVALFEFGRRPFIKAVPAYSITLVITTLLLFLTEPISNAVAITGRYVFGVPGAALAGMVFLRARYMISSSSNVIDQHSRHGQADLWCSIAGIALVVYAGLSMFSSANAPLPLLPGSQDFLHAVGLPIAVPYIFPLLHWCS